MPKFDLENLPVIESFKNLQYGDIVYSRKYGLGYVFTFHHDEIIVYFSGIRKRFSEDDREIRKVPDSYLRSSNKKINVNYEDKEMSYFQYKMAAGLTKKQIREEKLNYSTIKEASDILGITKSKLLEAISENNIQTKTFGRSVMVHRKDVFKLFKKL